MPILNIGSADVRYEGDVINLDIQEGINVDIIADARDLPYEDNYFDGIIASHILEHFKREEHFGLLIEWRRVLKHDCKMFIGCPDIFKCMQYYLDNKRGLRDSYWYQCIYGLADRRKFDTHLSGINEQYLTELLFKTGFRDLVWKKYDECEDHNIGVTATKKQDPDNLIIKPRVKK